MNHKNINNLSISRCPQRGLFRSKQLVFPAMIAIILLFVRQPLRFIISVTADQRQMIAPLLPFEDVWSVVMLDQKSD